MLKPWLALFFVVGVESAHALSPIEQEYEFELRNKATATVSVALSVANGTPIYRYSLQNNASSERGIISFNLQLDVDPASMRIESPSTWAYKGCCISDNKRNGASGIKVTGWLYNEDSAVLAPGTTLSGFGTIASTSTVPGIKRYFVESYTTKDMPNCQEICGDEAEDRRVAQFTDFFNNSTSGFTIGPSPIPISTDIGTLIANLIALKHQSAELGWLGNAKFVLKLDKRLDEAKAALAREKKKLARVRLSQFVHELETAHKEREHERGDDHHGKGQDKDEHHDKKFVNDEAFQLLKLNAEFIIAKLPAKARDRDEEDECRRAEQEKDDDHDEHGKKNNDRRGGKEHGR